MFIFNIWDLLAIFFIVITLVWWIYLSSKQMLQESKCTHDGRVKETSACDAICSKCGKNLGFISSDLNKMRRSAWQDENKTPWSS